MELRTATDWKNFGNKQFVLKRYNEALRAYSVGLSLCSNEDLDLLANRAAAYLNLDHFGLALQDANAVLKSKPNHPKAIYRKAKALLGQSKCDEAISFLQGIKLTKELEELFDRAETMKQQLLTKEYDVTEHFYKYFAKIENWAEYYGPVEVQNIPGKGKGLVATNNIKEGELIFNLRAFAIEFHEPDSDKNEDYEYLEDSIINHPDVLDIHDKGGCILAQKVYERLKQDPELGKDLYQLYAGPELERLDPLKDDCSAPDIKRISNIIRYNCFANSDDNSDDEKSSAIFILPSFYNHTCISNNCTWKIYGNFIMVRAYTQIQKGEELLISYASPTWSYKIRQSLLIERLGFMCGCKLCVLDRALGEEVIVVREKLQKLALKQQVEFVGLMGPDSDTKEIARRFQESSVLLLDILKRLEEMHPNHGILNVLVVDPLQQLGMKYFGVGEYEKAAECMLRCHSIMRAVALPHGSVECMLWVVGSYLQIGNKKMAKQYINVLKKDALLAHGTLKTLKMMGEWVINAMDEHNVPL